MGILKGVTPNDSGASAFERMVEYISNPEKTNNDYSSECEEFEAESFFARHVYHQQECKRHYKQYIVSLESEWEDDMNQKLICGKKLEKVIHECKLYYMEKGFRVLGYVHFNTAHPHFHILVDTCNSLTGKQLSESAHDLEEFKLFVSSKLMKHGLHEEILMNTCIISEEEMMQDDDFSDEYLDDESISEIGIYDNENYFDDFDNEVQDKLIRIFLNTEYPDECNKLSAYRINLDDVVSECVKFYNDKGFSARGYIHCNEQFKYAVVMVDNYSKLINEFPEADVDDESIKSFLFSKLNQMGLNAKISIELRNVSMEELCQSEEFDDEYLDNYTLSKTEDFDYEQRYDYENACYDEYYDSVQIGNDESEYLNENPEYDDWNNGTEEHTFFKKAYSDVSEPLLNNGLNDKETPLKVLCTVVSEKEKSQLEMKNMCTVVSKPEKKVLAMNVLCKVVSKSENERRKK